MSILNYKLICIFDVDIISFTFKMMDIINYKIINDVYNKYNTVIYTTFNIYKDSMFKIIFEDYLTHINNNYDNLIRY